MTTIAVGTTEPRPVQADQVLNDEGDAFVAEYRERDPHRWHADPVSGSIEAAEVGQAAFLASVRRCLSDYRKAWRALRRARKRWAQQIAESSNG